MYGNLQRARSWAVGAVAVLLIGSAAVGTLGASPSAVTAAPTLAAGAYRLTAAPDGRFTLTWKGRTLMRRFSVRALLVWPARLTLSMAGYPRHLWARAPGGRLTVTGLGGPWPPLRLSLHLTPQGLTLWAQVLDGQAAVGRFALADLRLPTPPEEAPPRVLLQGYGDYDGSREVPLASPSWQTSYWLTAVQPDRGPALVAGGLGARWAVPGARVRRLGGQLEVQLISGLDAPGVGAQPVPAHGGAVSSEVFWVGVGTSPWDLLRRYAAQVRRANPGPVGRLRPLVGYSTWGAEGPHPTAASAVQAARALRPLFPRGTRPYFEVDDGWERAYGDWQANAAFPGGMARLARTLRHLGWVPGVWVAPFLASPSAPVVRRHPDWWVRGPNGRPVTGAYGDEILDVTAPGAGAYLTDLFRTLAQWGYGMIKVDFLYEGSVSGRRYRPGVTGLQAYRMALADMGRGLREGRPQGAPPALLVASGAPLLPSVGWFDAWRTGPDIEDYVRGRTVDPSTLTAEVQAAAADLFLNGRLFAPDPDDVLLDPPGHPPEDQGWLLAVADAMTGGTFTDGDRPQALTPAQKRTLARVPWGRILAARPRSPVGWTAAGLPTVLRRQSGTTWFLAWFNWSDLPKRMDAALAALGLPGGHPWSVTRYLPEARPGPARTTLPAGGRLSVPLPPRSAALVRLTPMPVAAGPALGSRIAGASAR